MPSVSFRKSGTKTNIRHNNRERTPSNADPSRTADNITFVRRDIEEVYEEIFQPALEEYNRKQKRTDRKIENYYKKTLHDKKTIEQQEIIVQIGALEDAKENWEPYKDILNEYMTDFQERNEHLIVYNAVMHLDEATPHLHINFIPYADYDKGLQRRVNFEKALKQQGQETFADWREAEVTTLESLMRERNLVRELVGTHDKYLSPQEYKHIVYSAIKEAQQENNTLVGAIQAHRAVLKAEHTELPIEPKKGITGAYKLSDDEFMKYQSVFKENKVLKTENFQLTNALDQQKKENKRLLEILAESKVKVIKVLREELYKMKVMVQNLTIKLSKREEQINELEQKFKDETGYLEKNLQWAEKVIKTNSELNRTYQEGKRNAIKQYAFEKGQGIKPRDRGREL